MFNSLVWAIENVPRKHHYLAGAVIPISALLNMSLMAYMANWISEGLKISLTNENPVIAGIFYTVAFISPFLYSVFVQKKIELRYK